jgi:hypothetical protein
MPPEAARQATIHDGHARDAIAGSTMPIVG